MHVMWLMNRELLTYQQHYDWGLRALKTILKGCGSLLQINRKNLPEDGDCYCMWINNIIVPSTCMNSSSPLCVMLLFIDDSRIVCRAGSM